MFRYAIVACLALTLASAAEAQTTSRSKAKGKVSRMDIFSGGTQVVRYFGEGLTPSEQSTLRDLERLENETMYARGLITLKQQYVNDERLMETRRRIVQNQLYGLDITSSSFGGLGFVGGFGGGGFGRPGLLPGYAYTNYGYPVAAGFGPFGGIGAFGAGREVTVNRSLANGVGFEGAIKNAVAGTLAVQATPEFGASLERDFDRVALRAVASPTLQVALGLPSPRDTVRERDNITRVAGGEGGPVTVTLKSGEKLSGEKLDESSKDWVILIQKKGGKIRLRLSEVIRIDEAPGVKGAS